MLVCVLGERYFDGDFPADRNGGEGPRRDDGGGARSGRAPR